MSRRTWIRTKAPKLTESKGSWYDITSPFVDERDKEVDPYRKLAVAVIGEALFAMSNTPRGYQGKKCSEVQRRHRQKEAADFIASEDLEIWAQFTSMGASAWREVAREMASAEGDCACTL